MKKKSAGLIMVFVLVLLCSSVLASEALPEKANRWNLPADNPMQKLAVDVMEKLADREYVAIYDICDGEYQWQMANYPDMIRLMWERLTDTYGELEDVTGVEYIEQDVFLFADFTLLFEKAEVLLEAMISQEMLVSCLTPLGATTRKTPAASEKKQ